MSLSAPVGAPWFWDGPCFFAPETADVQRQGRARYHFRFVPTPLARVDDGSTYPSFSDARRVRHVEDLQMPANTLSD